jgi:pimeloyl-ACP methyl ester carboxylesterase
MPGVDSGHGRADARDSSDSSHDCPRILGAQPALSRRSAGEAAATVRKLVPAPPGAHWTEFPHGQHFPAMEAPAELAADLQAFFGPLP